MQIDLEPRRLFVTLCLSLALAPASFGFDQGEGGFFVDGNVFHDLCIHQPVEARQYVTGIYDAGQTMSVFYGGLLDPPRFCSPTGSKNTQYKDIACRYVAEHPELRTYGAAWLAIEALKEAWPCQ